MVENSVIINFFKVAYSNSNVKKNLNSIIFYISHFLSGSSVFYFFSKESFLSKSFDSSLFYQILNFVFGFPLIALRNLYSYFEDFVSDSVTIGLLKSVLIRFDLIIASMLFVIFIVPDKFWYNVYSLILAIVLYGLFIIRAVIYKHEGFQFNGMDFTFGLFFLIVFLSTITSVYVSISTRFLLFYLTCFLMVLVIHSYTRTETSLKTVISALLMGAFAISIFAIWQVYTHSVPFNPSFTDVESNYNMPGRVFSTMANPNNFAEILIMSFPFAVAMLLNSKTNFKRLLYFSCMLTIFCALLFTGSRSCWGAFVFIVFIQFFFKKPAWIPFLVLISILSIPLMPDFVIKRIMTLGNVSIDSSTVYRSKIFQTVKPMIRDYWFTGIGLGTDVFMRTARRYYLLTKEIPVHTHILFTQIWIEMGIFGLLSFLWCIFKNIKNASKMVFSINDDFLSNILVASICAISGVLVVSIVEYIWYYPRVMLIFWVIMAILMSAVSIAHAKKIKPSE